VLSLAAESTSVWLGGKTLRKVALGHYSLKAYSGFEKRVKRFEIVEKEAVEETL
jgi:hypothetical protein